jgi:hypothetical protein
MLKDPESAERIIAKAISRAEAPGAAVNKAERNAAADPKTKVEPPLEVKAKAPPASTPASAK